MQMMKNRTVENAKIFAKATNFAPNIVDLKMVGMDIRGLRGAMSNDRERGYKMKEKLIRNEHEAIEAIKSNIPTSGYYMLRESLDMAIKALEEVQQYRQIGTVEECREAVEKQNGKKPDYEGDGYADGQLIYDTWICPNCEKRYEVDYDDYAFCPDCGQKIDWKEKEHMESQVIPEDYKENLMRKFTEVV